MQARRDDPRPVSLSLQLYRFMVQFYPAPFRDQYGELMVQAFRDSCLHACRKSSSVGLFALWARTLMDIFLSVIEQYSNRGAEMTKSKWIQLSGWFLVSSGMLFLVGWLASGRPTFNEYNAESWPIDRFLNLAAAPSLILGMLFAALGFLGLQSRFGRQAGRLGQAGLVLSLLGVAIALIGIIGISIQDVSPWWQMSMIGTTALFVGLGLFGVSCIRLQLFSRWNSLPLLISIPWPLIMLANLLFAAMGKTFDLPWVIQPVLLFISFAGMAIVGYLLQSEANRVQPAA
jgi:hypothetical protein